MVGAGESEVPVCERLQRNMGHPLGFWAAEANPARRVEARNSVARRSEVAAADFILLYLFIRSAKLKTFSFRKGKIKGYFLRRASGM